MESTRKQIVLGILAHVDSGKTTLSEAMLYRAGAIRKLGRVDHGDAFLDTDSLEKARGITIFSKQALLTAGNTAITLLDTPGHVDFSTETERTLQVLDYAVLVVSGTDGVQSHTETLWRLLRRYHVPTFVFVNKMDLPGMTREQLLSQLNHRLGEGFVDFGAEPAARNEALALCDEQLMEKMLDAGTLTDADIIPAVARRHVFPCWFGAALRLDGLDGLLRGLQTLTRTPPRWPEFGARVFKISEDAGMRLTWLKVTGGVLHVKDVLPGGEKADALRLYNGGKFRLVSEALPGMVVAAAGPVSTRPGQGLGAESDAETPLLEPVLNYRVDCDADPHTLLKALQTLEGEDPQLHVNWRDDLGEVHVQLMGEVQLEILQTILQERFGLTVAFSEGGILYKETLTRAVEGIGHYEPLRHYAEVHLLLEPGARGSGVQLAADCPPDTLAENWQRLILTHLAERTHPGVLIGAPLTDVKITLAAGRAHQKHTEGGDFRQATYRAVRQGLRMAEAKDGVQLLEPWYDFTLELPADALGRAMADVQRMCGSFEAPETSGGTVRLTGRLPVATARGYAREVAAYTHGLGRWAVLPAGYDTCHNADEVLAAVGYDPDADTENPADSVFCAHGAGYLVKWDEVPARAHVSSGLERRLNGTPADDEDAAGQADANDRRRRAAAYRGTLEQDKELLAIFERTYGKIRRRGETGDAKKAARAALHTAPAAASVPAKPVPTGPDYLLVDGYNVIFAWDDLRRLADGNLDAARRRLMDILCNYAGYKRCVPILVFDAYKVRGGTREVEQYHNLYVVYTREAETADMYIERATHELAKEHRTRVVSSDGAEQIIVMGHGALRVSARAFEEEVRAVEKEIREFLEE